MDAMSSSSDVDTSLLETIDLEHPEILSVSQLQLLLIQHNVPEEYCCGADKEKLLEVYRKTVLPLPQREHYRQNRRGKFLSHSKQMHLNKKSSECGIKLSQAAQEHPKSAVTPVTNSIECHSRLKPPPIPIKFNNERIVCKTSNGSENGSLKSEPSNTKLVTDSNRKIIRLINDTLTSNVNSGPNEKFDSSINCKRNATNNLEEGTPPVKKHKPITWP